MLKQGLRASLQSANLITGQQVVTLDFVRNAPPAPLQWTATALFCRRQKVGGLAGLQASAGALLEKATTIPFDQIGANLNGILLAANNVANGEQMRRSLTELAATIATLKDLVGHVDSGASPALRQLPEIAAALAKTLANTNRMVQSVDSGYGDKTKFNRDLARLRVQANETLTSVRALSTCPRVPRCTDQGPPHGRHAMTGAGPGMRMALLFFMVALATCSTPNPDLYTIAPTDGPGSRPVLPRSSVLQQIGLARYLERSQIVRSSENYRLDVMQNDWWGEPLGSMLSRVLIEELSQRLQQSAVISENGGVSSPPDATLQLNILRLDEDAGGNLVLQAQAAAASKDGRHRRRGAFASW